MELPDFSRNRQTGALGIPGRWAEKRGFEPMYASFSRNLALVAAFGVCALAAPVRAAEDGQASLITGLGQSFGVLPMDEPNIDYRERGKLVVPPKKVLPPPGGLAARGDGAWPKDVEIIRDKKQKAMEDASPSARQMSTRSYQFYHPGDDVKVTTSSFNSHGPACRRPDPKTGQCPQAATPGIEWNPLTWVGLQKKAPSVLGPEPERQTLVDPPKGLRAPAEGVGAKIEN